MNGEITTALFVVIICNLGHGASAACFGGIAGLYDTDWATCLPSTDEEENCPHDFIKIGDNRAACGGHHTGGEPRLPYVCCLLTPVLNMKVKEAPCLTNTGGSSSRQKDVKDNRA